jgi:muconate cycloisomerase
MGRTDPREDVAVARAVRAAVGPGISLRADANQAYDAKTAIRVIREIEDLDIEFFEQPTRMHDIGSLRRVARATGVKIMADEAATDLVGLTNLIRAEAIDDVSIYVIGPGGLHQSKKMVALAEAFGLRGYIGGALETGIGAAAGVHLAASSPAVSLGCEMNGQFLLRDNLVTEPMGFADGALEVPTGPGLGVTPSEGSLDRYRVGEVVRVS